MSVFERIREELINRGFNKSNAAAQAASYARMISDDDIFDDEEIEIACMQIESMNYKTS